MGGSGRYADGRCTNQTFGACVAKTNPRPCLQACENIANMLRVHAVNPFPVAIVWVSSITSGRRRGREPAGLLLLHAKSAICNWFDELWHYSSGGQADHADDRNARPVSVCRGEQYARIGPAQ